MLEEEMVMMMPTTTATSCNGVIFGTGKPICKEMSSSLQKATLPAMRRKWTYKFELSGF